MRELWLWIVISVFICVTTQRRGSVERNTPPTASRCIGGPPPSFGAAGSTCEQLSEQSRIYTEQKPNSNRKEREGSVRNQTVCSGDSITDTYQASSAFSAFAFHWSKIDKVNEIIWYYINWQLTSWPYGDTKQHREKQTPWLWLHMVP